MGNQQVKLTPKELAKNNKRVVDRAVRSIEREQKKLQGQEVKCLKEIKALATKNQHGPAKTMAKNLVRIRSQVNNMYQMKAQLGAISMTLSTLQINSEMMSAMKGVNDVMGKVNEEMNIGDI